MSLNERRRCPECKELADVVLRVRSIGTGLEQAFGTVHSRKINGQGQTSHWKLYGHSGRG